MATPKNNNQSNKNIISSPKKETIKKKRFLGISVPLYISILIFIPFASVGFFIYSPHFHSTGAHNELNLLDSNTNTENQIGSETDTGMVLQKEKMLTPTKTKLNSYLEQKNREGAFTSASVYLNDLSTGAHIDINPDELYDPASIMKVTWLLVTLKKVQANPDYLTKKYIFKRSPNRYYTATIKDESLVEGKSYTVADLLYYMITYSDNEAFWLLTDQFNNNDFEQINAALGIPIKLDNIIRPNNKEKNFVATVGSVSRYFSVLYNATYLNEKWSLYALNLLMHSNYRDGMLKGMDPKIKVAHKFGERIELGQVEFHEFGIVYLKNRPYLLGVMSRGKQLNELQNMLSELSRIVFNEMKGK